MTKAAVAAVAGLLIACAPASARAPGLVAAYSFDEPSGAVARDGSGRGHAGRIAGARRTTAGRFGGALVFGRRDVVRVRGLPRPGRALTVEAWVKPRNRRWGAVVASGRYALAARRRGARVVARSRRAVANRRLRGWTHLAATHDGRRLRLYVDGAAVARRALRGRLPLRRALRIGGGFAGVIDEVRLHRRALSARQIRAGMRRRVARPPTAPPRTPGVDELPRLSAVTKDGITWTFARPMPVGQFVTGDYYVVGRATITAIDPAPANGRNGSVINLPAENDETGFDSRTEGNRYEPALRSDPPFDLAPGDSLVSSISVAEVGQARRWLFDIATDSPVRTVSVLTSVAAPQPTDAFRPSYVGRGAPIFLARNLRRDLLPRLAPVADMPSVAEFAEHFRRPWIDSLFFNFDSPIEYMPDYSREIARAVGIAGLLLALDIPPEQKEPLLVYLTQYGIDLWGLVQAGHPGWHAHGGHGSGRKLPIVLAGTLLGEPAMQRPGARFGEDMQTIHGTGWTGATALYAGHYGVGGDPEHGPYEHLQPRDWPGTLGEDYRRCCTSSAWIGEALAARLIPGVQTAWAHAPFFDYADRWMTEDDTQALAQIEAETGNDYSSFPQRRAWDRFVTNMWRAYRG